MRREERKTLHEGERESKSERITDRERGGLWVESENDCINSISVKKKDKEKEQLSSEAFFPVRRNSFRSEAA